MSSSLYSCRLYLTGKSVFVCRQSFNFKRLAVICLSCYFIRLDVQENAYDAQGSILISVTKKKSGKLVRQPVDFPRRGKSTYSSARSPLRGTMPARLQMASQPARLTSKDIITEIRMLMMHSHLLIVQMYKVYNG